MDRRFGYRGVVGVLGVSVLAAGGVTTAAPSVAGAAAAGPQSVAFTTAGCTSWSVPANVTSVVIKAVGGAGAGASASGGFGDGQRGTLSGLSGGSLYVCIDVGGGAGGGVGVTGTLPGAPGGGASGVSLGADFSQPVVVAGGGGGSGVGPGGSAGAPVAGNGSPAGEGGLGGDNLTKTGGAGGGGVGAAGSGLTAAGPGAGGTGAVGGSFFEIGFGGGGGGAGYYGGGGGGVVSTFIPHQPINGAGGGGGTDFCGDAYTGGTAIAGCLTFPGAGTNAAAGSAAGDPEVVIDYTVPTAAHLAASPLFVPLHVGQTPTGSAIAQLTNAGAPLAGRTLVFSAGSTTVCTVTTSSTGVAGCTFPLGAVVIAYLSGDHYTVTFAGDSTDLATSATGPVVIG